MERLTPQQSHTELYDEFIALAEIADQGGMHALWTGEHHGMEFTIAPNPFIHLADLARRTTNLRLGAKSAATAAPADLGRGARPQNATPTCRKSSASSSGSTAISATWPSTATTSTAMVSTWWRGLKGSQSLAAFVSQAMSMTRFGIVSTCLSRIWASGTLRKSIARFMSGAGRSAEVHEAGTLTEF